MHSLLHRFSVTSAFRGSVMKHSFVASSRFRVLSTMGSTTDKNVEISHLTLDNKHATQSYGDYARIMSQGKSGRKLVDITTLGGPSDALADKTWIRGRVQTVRVTGSACFMVIRQGSFNTIQVVYFKDKSSPEALEASQTMLKWLSDLTPESLVDIQGNVVSAQVKSCSVSNIEIALKRCFVVSRANILPFQLEDAARSEADITASLNTARPFPRLGQVTCLN
jgi:aspartyl-tRNA synthetase